MQLYQKLDDNQFVPVTYEIRYLLGDALQPYNRRIILTESGDFTPHVTTWAKVTCIGGGGAGGSQPLANTQAGRGGLPGGHTYFAHIKARGGGGGGGGRNLGGSGGGAAGEVNTDFVYLKAGESISAIVGAGGMPSPSAYNPWNDYPEYVAPGRSGVSKQGNYQGGIGGGAAGNGINGVQSAQMGLIITGNGGPGGTNGTPYGGGGGGTGGGLHASTTIQGTSARGGSNGENGSETNASLGEKGGAGGHGAIFIDFFDPSLMEEK